jgi:hypothetical protein
LNPIIRTVESHRVKLGCQLIDNQGTPFIAHNFCQNSEQLNKLIYLLRNNQFIGRLYTAPVVYQLHNKLSEAKIPQLPDLESYFSQIDHLNCHSIKEMAIILLEKLANCGNESIIKQICETDYDVTFRPDLFDKQIKPTYHNLNLGTTDAHKFLGPTLLVTGHPLEAANKYFEELVKNYDADKLIANYLKNKDIEERLFQRVQKQLESDTNAKNGEGISREQKNKEVEEAIFSKSSDIRFPNSRQINSIQHINKYASDLNIDRMPISKIRKLQCLTLLPFEARVTPDILLRLFTGVGLLLSDDHKAVDQSYTNYVISSCLEGELAFTISDETIIFGVNSPADSIIVEDSAIDNRSIGTIFQLLARVGRPGLSWTAYAYIGDNLKQLLLGYITEGRLGVTPIDNEAKNMNDILELVLNRTNQPLPDPITTTINNLDQIKVVINKVKTPGKIENISTTKKSLQFVKQKISEPYRPPISQVSIDKPIHVRPTGCNQYTSSLSSIPLSRNMMGQADKI